MGGGKKRLRALADWHFGGGAGYCAACEGPCPDCPARREQPLSDEGWRIWDLVLRLGGQLRLAPGPGPATVIGWDMTAALGLGAALGIAPRLVADALPEIEAVMVKRLNERMGAARDE